MKVSYMIYLKEQKGYSYDKLSELSGVPKGTIQKIFTGVTKVPRHDTLVALEKALLSTDNKDSITPDPSDNPIYCTNSLSVPLSAEESYLYNTVPKKKKYTLEDYYALPDEPRMELIDGDFFVMDAPGVDYQIITFQICYQIQKFIDDNDGDCEPFVSPCDVQLDCDEFTMVQPDVFVICNKDKLKKKNIYGAPEFVVEVLSPSTFRKDMGLKNQKYMNAGVYEYWIVDPERKQLYIHIYNTNKYWTGSIEKKSLKQEHVKKALIEESILDEIKIYTFNDKVPVALYDGRLEIDFPRIKKKLEKVV